MFELVVKNHRGNKWEWQVCDRGGKVIMSGFESSRLAARYRGQSALFLLLLAAAQRSS